MSSNHVGSIGPTGKPKNCNEWELYEEPGASSTARLCNGGKHEGEWLDPCPSRADCKLATLRASRNDNRRAALPNNRGGVPFGGASSYRGGSSVVASTAGRGQYTPTPMSPTRKTTPILENALRHLAESHAPVQAPANYPAVMRTPYAAPPTTPGGVMTPTFIPMDDEGILPRLAKNMAQGAVGAAGWQIYDLARTIDFFGRNRNTSS